MQVHPHESERPVLANTFDQRSAGDFQAGPIGEAGQGVVQGGFAQLLRFAGRVRGFFQTLVQGREGRERNYGE